MGRLTETPPDGSGFQLPNRWLYPGQSRGFDLEKAFILEGLPW